MPILLWNGILTGQVTFPFIYSESRAQTTLQLVSGGHKRALVPGFAASADACVSFDGLRVLFSGKQKASDPWQIWEIAIAGGAPRRITNGKDDAIAPFYLPAGKLVYSQRTGQGLQLEIMPLDGSTPPLPLTYAPGDHIATDVLNDGRILFQAPHPDGASKIRDIYTVYPDGTGVETYRCDHTHDRHAARQISSGDIVFETAGGLARFTSSRAVELPIAMPAGRFAGPIAEIAPGDWLVSYRPDDVRSHGLYRWTQGVRSPEKVLAATGADLRAPVLVRPRTTPKWFPSSLGDRDGANILCLNVYTSKERIPDAIVRAVRVWSDAGGKAVALGEAPVEKDGSFYLNVPTERPIRFELLDENRKTVAAEKGWFWMRRGEQRVCVGCHAGPERAPDNAVPEVLLRTTIPAKMELPK